MVAADLVVVGIRPQDGSTDFAIADLGVGDPAPGVHLFLENSVERHRIGSELPYGPGFTGFSFQPVAMKGAALSSSTFTALTLRMMLAPRSCASVVPLTITVTAEILSK